MRVRINRPFYFAKRNVNYKPGDVVDAPKDDAEVWIKAGVAMQDKSLDGPSKTKKTRRVRSKA